MPYSLYLRADLAEQRLGVAHQALGARAVGEVHLAAARVHRIDEPRVHAEQLGELLRHLFVGGEVVRLPADRPAGVQRRQQVLLVQALEDLRDPAREVVVEQDRAGVEVLQAEAVPRPHQRLDGEGAAIGKRHVGRRGDRFIERAEADVEPGLVEDLHQPRDVHQVERVAGVPLGDQKQVLRFRADLLDRRHRRLHGERQHLGGQVVEAARKQVGVDRRELEAGVPQVDRGVERRRVLHPLEPEPPLDRRQRLEHALLELVDRPGQGGDEVRDHGGVRWRDGPEGERAGILGIWGARAATQATAGRATGIGAAGHR